jgi:bifunctional DNA-binding transcriptional regulator/antitoxin component of YhaV-PrlF toxin-antitoxin module
MEHKFKLESEIRTKYQITIPEEIRVKAKLAVGVNCYGSMMRFVTRSL